MDHLWLGASANDASYVFLLPNKPDFPDEVNSLFIERPDVSSLIELNGNHWRKIFTIMAKLTSPTSDAWKVFRDHELFGKVGVAFSHDQLVAYKGIVIVVGNTFREQLVIPVSAKVIGDRHVCYVSLPYIWCPYLDYRQFPNRLIDALREYILERKC